ncbi:sodium-dependent proline transporter-like [Anticarsia gemmatalis]|uniref:sodium-dependent proline transporter-like n=1 Tax=Anticarsia gemmatalis TaxID=129554 RepID=UPI003F7720CF
MLPTVVDISSSTLIIGEKVEFGRDSHFRWKSIKQFLDVGTTMSSTAFNFDIFARLSNKVRLLDFLIMESTIGLSYICMDSFLKLYTRRLDCDRYLNPLLRGVSYGQFLHTGYFSIIHGAFIADTVRFLPSGLKNVPNWAICMNQGNNTCVPTKDILVSCNNNETTVFSDTSAFHYYTHYFSNENRGSGTSRLFVAAIIWILVFFLASVTEETIVKIFKLCHGYKVTTTLVTLFCLMVSRNKETWDAFTDIVDVTTDSSWDLSLQLVCYTYGIGFLGIYDFGGMSPFTMIDTTSVIFLISFTILSFLRSWILRILYLSMKRCVVVDESIITTHCLFYSVLPLTTDFMQAQKLYVLFLFGNLTITLMSFETFMVATMSKFLHYEFKNVKQIYIVGMVCATGYALNALFLTIFEASTLKKSPFNMYMEARGQGLYLTALYLSALRTTIIMWVYGVKKFSTDIHFWLGFHPTKFWTLSWMALPIVFIGFMIYRILSGFVPVITTRAMIWMGFLVFVVTSIQLKTVVRYLMTNVSKTWLI